MRRTGNSKKHAASRQMRWQYVAVCAALVALGSQSTESAEPMVYIRHVVRTDYGASGNTLRQLRTAPRQTIVVQPNDSLSSIISRRFGVGPSNAPRAYASIEQTIRNDNQLKATEPLRANARIRVPDLPRIGFTSPNPTNPYDTLPKISIRCPLPATADPLCAALKSSPLIAAETPSPPGSTTSEFLFDELRKGSQTVVQIRAVPASEALRLEREAPNDYQIESAPLKIVLAASEPTGNVRALPISDSQLIRHALLGPPKRHPVLIILDDSWPDDQSFKDSRDFFVTAISAIRMREKMGPAKFSSAFKTANATSWQAALPIDEHGHPITPHSEEISQSLEMLRGYEPPDRRVTVIYLPVSRVQKYANELLANLVAMNLIAKTMGPMVDDPIVPVTSDVQQTALKEAQTFVSNTGSTIGRSIQTDQAIVEAVLTFARLYASFPDRPVFLNMSWVVPNLQFAVVIPDDTYGLNVVAAGNDCPDASCGVTIYTAKPQFAFRSWTPPGDMLAVMNIDVNGDPTCDSSLLEVSDDVFGVAFDGSLSATTCGTSFAAPRVAWLIAAREAMRTPEPDTQHWIAALHREIIGMRDPKARAFNRMRLNVTQLFAHIH
jgi:hypothetical protein